MEQTAIETTQLSFCYGKKEILKDLSISFPKEKFSVILGVNGSGKSTLMKILAGLETGFSGQIRFFNKNIKKLKGKEKAATVGYLSQDFQSVFPLSVKDILLTGRGAFSTFSFSKRDVEQVEAISKELDLQHLLHEPFNILSGGQQQRVLIGRILVQNPKIILLDEPTNHLDIFHKQELMKHLQQLTLNGFTVIAIMHDPTLAFRYADEIYYVHNKTLTKSFNTKAQDLQQLSEVFGANFLCLTHGNKDYIVAE